MARIAVGTAVRAAFGAVAPGWRTAWGALGLALLISGGSEYLSRSQSGRLSLAATALIVLSIIAGVMVRGALYRTALQPDHPDDRRYRIGVAGVQWGDFEWRVLGASVVVGLIEGVAIVVAFLVWAVILGIMIGAHAIDASALSQVRQGGDSPWPALFSTFANPAGMASLVVLAIGLIGVLFLAARFSLAAIAYADTGEFNLGAAWSLTRGAMPAIIATLIAIYVATAVPGVAGARLDVLVGGASGAHGGMIWGGVLGALIGAAISGPALAGLTSYVYRTQSGSGSGVAAVFS
jgi:hypothetical protein